jgi:molybdenum cofactor cytidylyltransferase
MNVAIILAAGESRRMGAPKQLLPFAGTTMLQCVIDAFVSPKIDQIIVVLGCKADEIAAKLREGEAPAEPPGTTARREARPPKLGVVTNVDWRAGMFTSVQAGLRALPAGTKLVLLGLCDQPRLKRATVDKLVAKFSGKILVPTFKGRQGHPLLFEARYVREILALDETLTLKHFLANHPDEIARLPVDDEGVLVDIDDRATYERELNR